MPTSAVMTFSGKKLEPYYRPEDAVTQAVRLAASLTLARGTILGEVSATPGTFKAYDAGNGDGSEVAKAILAFDVMTDSSGLITLTTDTAGGDLGQTVLSVPAYMQGFFKTSELTGLDADGLAQMGGALVSGTLADGVIRIG